ncbi:unnamed protein product [Phyllotreta striolata]|uniref:N-glycosylase/DNA lyase n=1 Tax=Phyllotreta striolata TaxID=444603 RepID=A0A9N9TNH1_PHYSR|nr:unnamed protein product [Phyllotreta striolata]
MNGNWFKLLCSKKELQLEGTLNGGQSFRWKKHPQKHEQWIGVFLNKLWILEQKDDCIMYQVHEKKSQIQNEKYYNQLLKNYFQLNLDLRKHYSDWSESDQYFKDAAKQFYGIRILQQDVTENIFSFICSSNNHISRITSMVEKLAQFYGDEICQYDGQTYHSFPTVNSLAPASVEQKLRTNGFGYRAKYISKSAQYIVDKGGEDWLEKLKEMDYTHDRKALMALTGVGAKVADCISLMSLGHLESVPVDTHVYQIAKRLYMHKLPTTKTVTDKIYSQIGDYFRQLYGPYAGWAQTVLFCADLKKFQGNNIEISEAKNPKKMRS